MDIQLTNELYANGTLTKMFKSGLISAKVFTYREYYLCVDGLVKSGLNKCDAVKMAMAKFNTDKRTIYRALSAFSDTILSQA